MNEYVVQERLGTNQCVRRGFAFAFLPQLVLFGESSFKLPTRNELFELRFGGAAIACMRADVFP